MRNKLVEVGSPITVSILAVFLFLVALPQSARSDEVDSEIQFATGLISLGLPDYAEKVAIRLRKKYPDRKDVIQLIDIQVLIGRRKFVEAEEQLNALGASDAVQAVRLKLAQGYFLGGNREKARIIYDDFFSKYERVPTDEMLRQSYMEAAYQFAQMLEQDEDFDGAAKQYERILAAQPPKPMQRRLKAEQAMLYVRVASEESDWSKKERHLANAQEICEELQWGGIDIWFGHCVVTLARAQLARGQEAKAEKELRANLDILKQIDGLLKEEGMTLDVSPMSGARFLLGEIYENNGKRLKGKGDETGAIEELKKSATQFFNVFAKYADSKWGAEAGMRADKVRDQLAELGVNIRPVYGEHTDKISKAQFKLADTLFREKNYAGAIEGYLPNLNEYPETEKAIRALVNLGISYVETGDDLHAKMLCLYLAERFRKRDGVANGLLKMGQSYFKKKNEDMYLFVYEVFLESFPKHQKAPAILFTLAAMRQKAGDLEGAKKYYDRIVRRYPKDRNFLKALDQLAQMEYRAKNYAESISLLKKYVKLSRPGFGKARAQFQVADTYLNMDEVRNAAISYETLIKWISPEESPYNELQEDAKKNAELLRKSMYQRGYCYARLSEPPEKIPAYRSRAIKSYDQYVQNYPKSELAPVALSQKGAVQMELGKHTEATETFEVLGKTYPNSREGKSADLSVIRSAMEIKLYDIAKDAFEKMLKTPDRFSAPQFTEVGQLMMDAQLYEEAIRSYRQVMSSANDDERALIERALHNAGVAYFELKQYDRAVRGLEELFNRYPKSGLFYSGKFTLGISLRELGEYEKAVETLRDVYKMADDATLVHKASYELGLIQKASGDPMQALASFTRVALLADPSDPEQRPVIHRSILEGIATAQELERYVDVVDLSEQYLKDFPEGERIKEIRSIRADAKLKAVQAKADITEPESQQPVQ